MVRCGPVGVKDSYPETSNPQVRFRETPVDLCFQAITELSPRSPGSLPTLLAMADGGGVVVAASGRMVRGPGVVRRERSCAHLSKLVGQRVLGDACLAGRSRGRMRNLQPFNVNAD